MDDLDLPRWLLIVGIVGCLCLSVTALVWPWAPLTDGWWVRAIAAPMPLPAAAMLIWNLLRGDRQLF